MYIHNVYIIYIDKNVIIASNYVEIDFLPFGSNTNDLIMCLNFKSSEIRDHT